MSYFLHILLQNIIPLAIVTSIGMLMRKLFHLDVKTLTKLQFYVFGPAVMFVMLYETDISLKLFSSTILFFSVFFFLLYAASEAVARFIGYSPAKKATMNNSVLFYNSANFGLPLIQLAFSNNPLAVSIQTIIMALQNLLPFTYGVASVNAHKMDKRQIVRSVLKLPTIYVIPLALLLRAFSIPIPTPISLPLHYLSSAFFASALIALGAQLATIRWSFSLKDVLIANFLRLIAGPVLAYVVVRLLSIEGTAAQVLLVSSSVPTALNTVLLAIEYDNEPEFATQIMLASTLFSMVTVTFVIYFANLLFG